MRCILCSRICEYMLGKNYNIGDPCPVDLTYHLDSADMRCISDVRKWNEVNTPTKKRKRRKPKK